MTHASDNNETSNDSTQCPEGTPEAPGFRIGNVLKVVIPLMLLGAGGVVFFGYFDGLQLLSSVTNPVLVPATGQVIYDGQPLEGAIVSTRHIGGKMSGAIGWTDDHGRFAFKTDINGYVDGAYAGEHQVMIVAYQTTSAPAAPPLSTPQIYASAETTPLRITISELAEENKFEFALVGEPPERSSANSGWGGGRPAAGGAGGFDPEAIVGRVFEDYDKDGDDQLSGGEMQVIEGDRAERIRQADANEDGVVDRDELLQALSAPRRPE